MQLKSALTEISGLRYMVDKLDIKSGLGHRVLLASPFLVSQKDVLYQLQQVAQAVDAFNRSEHKETFDKVAIKLSQVRDIAGTIKNIQKHLTLNDIELFEVKSFALLANEIRDLTPSVEFLHSKLPNLDKVIAILDPENTRLPSFYINSAFAPELTELRKKLASVEFTIEELETTNTDSNKQYKK